MSSLVDVDGKSAPASWEVSAGPADAGELVLRLAGAWTLQGGIPRLDEVRQSLQSLQLGAGVMTVGFDAGNLAAWDSGLLTFLFRLMDLGRQGGLAIDLAGLPRGVHRLLDLATAVPERAGARREARRDPFLVVVGKQSLEAVRQTADIVEFVGEATLAFARLFRGKARFRRSDLGRGDRHRPHHRDRRNPRGGHEHTRNLTEAIA